ncbi:MAG: aminotransferase class I/II-fold pyridoxal phosphate-dependent enzyme, partial [Anaerolineales bacterium]|nr:aminotransferase class I/II-fold pyridoxal phosphate-dependent enzyme [Anaerolineales bacterium]
DLTRAIRLAHQYVVDCSATPMQHGAAAALRLPDEYFADYAHVYAAKRDSLIKALRATGLDVSVPQGSYFILAGIEPLGFDDDFAFCRHLIRDVGVASIPPSAFFSPTHRYIGRKYARFAFCKTPELLQRATERLATLGIRP